MYYIWFQAHAGKIGNSADIGSTYTNGVFDFLVSVSISMNNNWGTNKFNFGSISPENSFVGYISFVTLSTFLCVRPPPASLPPPFPRPPNRVSPDRHCNEEALQIRMNPFLWEKGFLRRYGILSRYYWVGEAGAFAVVPASPRTCKKCSVSRGPWTIDPVNFLLSRDVIAILASRRSASRAFPRPRSEARHVCRAICSRTFPR